MERTLVLLKPDALKLGLQDMLLRLFRMVGLTRVSMKRIQLSREFILKWRDWDHYDDWFWVHVDFMCSRPVEIWLLEGTEAVEKALHIKNQVRASHSTSEIQNVLHCPDSCEEAVREIDIFLNGRD